MSNVLSQPREPKAGGVLRRNAVALGNTLLTTFELTLHTTATPGSSALVCE
ncbi:MAG: hypothetical protein QM765_28585 [Myxococcales bacterium]